MTDRFVKLSCGILDSTLWQYDSDTKVVWITLLTMADYEGIVTATIPGISRRAGVSIEAVEKAFDRFSSPDKYSRTKDFEGRRIAPYENEDGWIILNFDKYKLRHSKEERKEQKRRWWNENRSKEAEQKRIQLDAARQNQSSLEQASPTENKKESKSKNKNEIKNDLSSQGLRPFEDHDPMREESNTNPSSQPLTVPHTDQQTKFELEHQVVKEVKPVKRRKKKKSDDDKPHLEIWHAYAWAYEQRYGVKPATSGKNYAHCKRIMGRIPMSDAPHVALHFVQSNHGWYVNKGHSLQCFENDCEKLRTDWLTGRQGTAAEAREVDQREAQGQVYQRVIEKFRREEEAAETGGQNGAIEQIENCRVIGRYE